MRRLLNSMEMKNLPISVGYEMVKSLNQSHCVTSETKIIIVGTITPPKACGYFYTSPYNCIYGYIDSVRGTDLCGLKKKLKSNVAIKANIISLLEKEKIAFLDVIDEAIRKTGSSADDDIANFSLDYSTFETVFNIIPKGGKVKVICNSRLAQDGYIRIKEASESKGITLPEPIYISQVRRLQKREKPKWLQELK